MKTLKNLERLQQLHNLIETEKTGTPLELANKMDISERLVYNLLEKLKDLNANIGYNRKNKTYYYDDDFILKVKISITVISNNELTEIFAGSYFFKRKYFSAGFVQ